MVNEDINMDEEDSLEDIIIDGSIDDDDLEEVIISESDVRDVSGVGLTNQLAGALSQGTTRHLESSDLEQEGAEILEDVLRREWRPEDEKKVDGDFYSGNKDDVYASADTYKALSSSGKEKTSSQDFYDSNHDINYKHFGEVEGIGFGPDVVGVIKKEDVAYETKAY